MHDFSTKLQRALKRQRGELPQPDAEAAEFVRLAKDQGARAAVAYFMTLDEDVVPHILALLARG